MNIIQTNQNRPKMILNICSYLNLGYGMQIKRNVEKNRRNYLTVSSLVTIVLISFFSPINAYGEFENLHDNDLYQRPQRFSFGLGKRSTPVLSTELQQMLARWGMGGPHGLFKRTFQDQQNEIGALDRDLKSLGWWGLSGPHGLFKRSWLFPKLRSSGREASYIFGKRSSLGTYNFGLGKRNQQFSFGLG